MTHISRLTLISLAAFLAAAAPDGGKTTAATDAASRAYATVLKEAYQKMGKVTEGKNADYIPALAEVPSDYRGIVIVTVDGRVLEIGDTRQAFTIQSVS